MSQLLLVFYVLFFATGFMGGAALLLLDLRLKSNVLRPLLAFQLLFLIGMGLIVVYYYLESLPGGLEPGLSQSILAVLMAINAAVYGIVAIITRRAVAPRRRNRGLPLAAQIAANLVVIKSLANAVAILSAASGSGFAANLAGSAGWNLAGHLLSAVAMAAFGLAVRGALNPHEPPSLRSLLRVYGLCGLIFAPIGLLEYAIQAAEITWLPSISFDHFFYLAWNLISMSAAIRLFKPNEEGTPFLESIPEERAQALGLSTREKEMALMIARGLANKEIAAELGISPATVRTHIYNLYQKAGARSRVELLNKLRS